MSESKPRIDLVVPGPEGEWLSRAFREEGFEVTTQEFLKPTGADLYVVAHSVPSFEKSVLVFREHEESSPLVVVGWEPLTEERIRELKVDVYYPRPVPIARLLRKVQTLLSSGEHLQAPTEAGTTHAPDLQATLSPPAPPRQDSAQLTLGLGAKNPEDGEVLEADPDAYDDDDPPTSQDLAIPDSEPPQTATRKKGSLGPPPEPPSEAALPLREPTIQLDDMVRSAAFLSGVHSAEAHLDTEPAQHQSVSRLAVELNAELVDLLRAADERVFPGEPALDLRFPTGDESAHELVPDELLAEAALPIELAVEVADPLEAFTFVGAPPSSREETSSPVIVSVEAQVGSSAGGSQSQVLSLPSQPGSRTGKTPITSLERSKQRSEEQSAAGSQSKELDSSVDSQIAREGVLPEAGALGLLWPLIDRGRSLRVRFQVAGGPTMTLCAAGDRLLSLDGPVRQRVVQDLSHEGRIVSSAQDEASADELLRRLEQRGVLSRFELEQKVRLAREGLLADLAFAREAKYDVLPEERTEAGTRSIARGLLATMVEGLRRRMRMSDLERLLSLDRHVRVQVGRGFWKCVEQCAIEPEVALSIESADGAPLASLLTGLPATAGIAGVVFALATADALRFEEAAEQDKLSARALRDRIERLGRLAEEADYFRMLGLSRETSSREVAEAYDRQCSALCAVDLVDVGLEDLEDARAAALDALDEARDLLADPRLRDAYAKALERLSSSV